MKQGLLFLHLQRQKGNIHKSIPSKQNPGHTHAQTQMGFLIQSRRQWLNQPSMTTILANSDFHPMSRTFCYSSVCPICWYNRMQGWAKKVVPGLVNFVPIVAYNFCLNLPDIFSQPCVHFLAQPYRNRKDCSHNYCFIQSSMTGMK